MITSGSFLFLFSAVSIKGSLFHVSFLSLCNSFPIRDFLALRFQCSLRLSCTWIVKRLHSNFPGKDVLGPPMGLLSAFPISNPFTKILYPPQIGVLWIFSDLTCQVGGNTWHHWLFSWATGIWYRMAGIWASCLESVQGQSRLCNMIMTQGWLLRSRL